MPMKCSSSPAAIIASQTCGMQVRQQDAAYRRWLPPCAPYAGLRPPWRLIITVPICAWEALVDLGNQIPSALVSAEYLGRQCGWQEASTGGCSRKECPAGQDGAVGLRTPDSASSWRAGSIRLIPVIQTTKDTRAERVAWVGLDQDVKGGQFPAAHVAALFIRKVKQA